MERVAAEILRQSLEFALDPGLDVVSYNLCEHPEDKIITVKNIRQRFNHFC